MRVLGVGHVDASVPGGRGDGGEPEPGDHGGAAERVDDGGVPSTGSVGRPHGSRLGGYREDAPVT
eukprot:456650-Hanusia_phi.AAC.1